MLTHSLDPNTDPDVDWRGDVYLILSNPYPKISNSKRQKCLHLLSVTVEYLGENERLLTDCERYCQVSNMNGDYM